MEEYSTQLAGKEKVFFKPIIYNSVDELEGIMLSEISQSEKDNYHMVSLIYGI